MLTKKKLHAVIAITVLTELGQSVHITALLQVEFRLPLLVKTSTPKKVVGNKYEHCMYTSEWKNKSQGMNKMIWFEVLKGTNQQCKLFFSKCPGNLPGSCSIYEKSFLHTLHCLVPINSR